MPSKTAKQAKLMRIAAHTPGGFGGVPQSVGQDFMHADMHTRREARRTARAVKHGFKKV